jgi:hypothetical protein
MSRPRIASSRPRTRGRGAPRASAPPLPGRRRRRVRARLGASPPPSPPPPAQAAAARRSGHTPARTPSSDSPRAGEWCRTRTGSCARRVREGGVGGGNGDGCQCRAWCCRVGRGPGPRIGPRAGLIERASGRAHPGRAGRGAAGRAECPVTATLAASRASQTGPGPGLDPGPAHGDPESVVASEQHAAEEERRAANRAAAARRDSHSEVSPPVPSRVRVPDGRRPRDAPQEPAAAATAPLAPGRATPRPRRTASPRRGRPTDSDGKASGYDSDEEPENTWAMPAQLAVLTRMGAAGLRPRVSVLPDPPLGPRLCRAFCPTGAGRKPGIAHVVCNIASRLRR